MCVSQHLHSTAMSMTGLNHYIFSLCYANQFVRFAFETDGRQVLDLAESRPSRHWYASKKPAVRHYYFHNPQQGGSIRLCCLLKVCLTVLISEELTFRKDEMWNTRLPYFDLQFIENFPPCSRHWTSRKMVTCMHH